MRPPPDLPLVHLVDDDEAIRDALAWLFKSCQVPCASYASAELFLARLEADNLPKLMGCVLLDMRMSGMTGIELFEHLRHKNNRLPVIFLTGHGDVPMAVNAIKNGAFDFFEKPFNDNQLVNRVLEAIAEDARRREATASQDSRQERYARLTAREKQIMERVLAGKFNKVIADELNISMRTVEVHRASLFEKMGVKTAVELANLMQSS